MPLKYFRKKLADWEVVEPLSDDEDWSLVSDGANDVMNSDVNSETKPLAPSKMVKGAAYTVIAVHALALVGFSAVSVYDFFSTSSNINVDIGDVNVALLPEDENLSIMNLTLTEKRRHAKTFLSQDPLASESESTKDTKDTAAAKKTTPATHLWQMLFKEAQSEEFRYSKSSSLHRLFESDNAADSRENNATPSFKNQDDFKKKFLAAWIRKVIVYNQEKKRAANPYRSVSKLLNYNVSVYNTSLGKKTMHAVRYYNSDCQVGICFPETDAEKAEERMFFEQEVRAQNRALIPVFLYGCVCVIFS